MIVERIRKIAPAFFVVGVKLNANDYVQKNVIEKGTSALEHARIIASWGLIDFLEVSGGDYENPGMYNSWDPLHCSYSSGRFHGKTVRYSSASTV